MAETIELAEGQCAAVFKNDGPPELYLNDEPNFEAEATPAMLQMLVIAYLGTHPDRLQAIVDEAIADLQANRIILPD